MNSSLSPVSRVGRRQCSAGGDNRRTPPLALPDRHPADRPSGRSDSPGVTRPRPVTPDSPFPDSRSVLGLSGVLFQVKVLTGCGGRRRAALSLRICRPCATTRVDSTAEIIDVCVLRRSASSPSWTLVSSARWPHAQSSLMMISQLGIEVPELYPFSTCSVPRFESRSEICLQWSLQPIDKPCAQRATFYDLEHWKRLDSAVLPGSPASPQ